MSVHLKKTLGQRLRDLGLTEGDRLIKRYLREDNGDLNGQAQSLFFELLLNTPDFRKAVLEELKKIDEERSAYLKRKKELGTDED